MSFLEFDLSESADGATSLDAMASVPEARWPELERELMQLLAWARAQGECAPLEEGGDWDFDLSVQEERQQALAAEPDWGTGRLLLRATGPSPVRRVVSLTLSVREGLAEAFREHLLGA